MIITQINGASGFSEALLKKMIQMCDYEGLLIILGSWNINIFWNNNKNTEDQLLEPWNR